MLDEEREPARLGRNLATTGLLDPETVELSLSRLWTLLVVRSGAAGGFIGEKSGRKMINQIAGQERDLP